MFTLASGTDNTRAFEAAENRRIRKARLMVDYYLQRSSSPSILTQSTWLKISLRWKVLCYASLLLRDLIVQQYTQFNDNHNKMLDVRETGSLRAAFGCGSST